MKYQNLRDIDRGRKDFREPDQPKALIVIKHEHDLRATVSSQICSVLELIRVPYEIRGPAWYFKDLEVEKLFEVIIFINLESYYSMNEETRFIIKKYCKTYDIGMVIMHWATGSLFNVDIMPLSTKMIPNVTSTTIEISNPIWRITKGVDSNSDGLNKTQYEWIGFGIKDDQTNVAYYTPLMYASSDNDKEKREVVGFADNGQRDGIRKVVIGNTLDYWFNHCVFLDALHHASSGSITIPTKRTVIIDIDDLFLGASEGKKITASDVRVGCHIRLNVFGKGALKL